MHIAKNIKELAELSRPRRRYAVPANLVHKDRRAESRNIRSAKHKNDHFE